MAADFFTVEVWTAKGLQRFLVLFLIDLSSRRVQIAGISAEANGLWMGQIARNLTDTADGLVAGKRYLIHDRDPLFTAVLNYRHSGRKTGSSAPTPAARTAADGTRRSYAPRGEARCDSATVDDSYGLRARLFK